MATKQQVVTDLVKHDPDTYIGLVGSPEFGTPDFAKHRKKLSKDKRVVGVRMRERPRDKDFFNDDVWRDLSLLADMNQTLDVRMFHYSSEDADMIAERIPNLQIPINHAVGTDIEGQPADGKWIAGVRKAAAHPNVYCKSFGLFQQPLRTPSPIDLNFYESTWDVLTDEFDENRLLYGSN